MVVTSWKTTEVLLEVLKERKRQDAKWGRPSQNPDRRMNILMEEVGEASKAILEQDIQNYRTELIQIAAVAVANVEALDDGSVA